jgi:hypothetical protein
MCRAGRWVVEYLTCSCLASRRSSAYVEKEAAAVDADEQAMGEWAPLRSRQNPVRGRSCGVAEGRELLLLCWKCSGGESDSREGCNVMQLARESLPEAQLQLPGRNNKITGLGGGGQKATSACGGEGVDVSG